jgi:5,10-methylenetetrahydrofolate reductase
MVEGTRDYDKPPFYLKMGELLLRRHLFTEEDQKAFYEYAKKFDVKILAGILLLKSAKMAHFLNNNVPGVTVPKHLIDEMEKAPDQLAKGVEIAARQVKELKTFCDGAHIMAIGQEESVSDIIEAAG